MRKVTDLQLDLQGTSEAWFIFCNKSPNELLAKNYNIFRQIAPIDHGYRTIAVVPHCFAKDFDKYLRKDVELAPIPFDNGNAVAFAYDCAVKQGLDCALFAQCDSAIAGIAGGYSVLDNQFTAVNKGGELVDVYLSLRDKLDNSCKIAGVFDGKEGLHVPLSFFVCDLQGLADYSANAPSENNLARLGLKWLAKLPAKGLFSLQSEKYKLLKLPYISDLDWKTCGYENCKIPQEMTAEADFTARCKGIKWD